MEIVAGQDGRLTLRFRRLLVAAYFFEVGLLLLIVPWSAFWDRNLLLEAIPAVYDVSRAPFVRGLVSGLGFLNIMAGMLEVFAVLRAPGTPRGPRHAA